MQHYLMHLVLCNELNDSLIIIRLPVFMYINFNTTNCCLKQVEDLIDEERVESKTVSFNIYLCFLVQFQLYHLYVTNC